jgi:hypothetical protein
VAESVKKLLSDKQEDEETHANLGTLSSAIVERLKAQVTQPMALEVAAPQQGPTG